MTGQSVTQKEGILRAAAELVSQKGVHRTTLDQVAKRAGCAKGLINYHFRTKALLIGELTDSVVAQRAERWSNVLRESSIGRLVDDTWSLLCEETLDDSARLWWHLMTGGIDPQTVRRALQTLADCFGQEINRVMTGAGATPTVDQNTLGLLVLGLVNGFGFQLLESEPGELFEPWAAGWLGLLALTE